MYPGYLRVPLATTEAVTVARRHFERCFPKVCGYCGRRFDSLRTYVLETRQRGVVVSAPCDDVDGDSDPLDVLAFATCQCGNTLALGTEFMEAADQGALLQWVRHECKTRRVSPTVVLNDLRMSLQLALSARPA